MSTSSSSENFEPLRTYYYNFALYLAIDLLSLPLLWCLSPSNTLKQDEGDVSDEQRLSKRNHRAKQNFLAVLLNFANVRSTFLCFFKPRPGRQRAQIYLLYAILFSQVLIFFGNQDVFFQFSERGKFTVILSKFVYQLSPFLF